MEDLGIAGFPSWAKIWRLERAGHLGAQLPERVRVRKLCKMKLGLVTTAFLARLQFVFNFTSTTYMQW